MLAMERLCRGSGAVGSVQSICWISPCYANQWVWFRVMNLHRMAKGVKFRVLYPGVESYVEELHSLKLASTNIIPTHT